MILTEEQIRAINCDESSIDAAIYSSVTGAPSPQPYLVSGLPGDLTARLTKFLDGVRFSLSGAQSPRKSMDGPTCNQIYPTAAQAIEGLREYLRFYYSPMWTWIKKGDVLCDRFNPFERFAVEEERDAKDRRTVIVNGVRFEDHDQEAFQARYVIPDVTTAPGP